MCLVLCRATMSLAYWGLAGLTPRRAWAEVHVGFEVCNDEYRRSMSVRCGSIVAAGAAMAAVLALSVPAQGQVMTQAPAQAQPRPAAPPQTAPQAPVSQQAPPPACRNTGDFGKWLGAFRTDARSKSVV